MCQENKEEEDSTVVEIAWMHQYNDTTTTQKVQRKRPEIALINWVTTDRKQKWEEKQLFGYFKRQADEISHEKTWT